MNVKCTSDRNRERGAAAVEFALISAAFVTLLFGIIEFGRVLFYMNSAAEATRWGARCAVVSDQNAPLIKDGMIKKLGILSTDKINVSYLPSGCNINTCNSVTVSIQDLNVQTYVPFVPFALTMPPFSTTLPRESMETVTDANHPNCAVP